MQGWAGGSGKCGQAGSERRAVAAGASAGAGVAGRGAAGAAATGHNGARQIGRFPGCARQGTVRRRSFALMSC